MTQTITGADVRGYYTALGITIPDWARTEAPVSCFANPDAHRRADRDPSCSINLQHGAWNCHGCGAKGSAKDAATARGYSHSQAIDLMAAHRLTTHTAHHNTRQVNTRPESRRPNPPAKDRQQREALSVTETNITAWHTALKDDPERVQRLARTRAWEPGIIDELQLGLHRGRITIPIRDPAGQLQGVLRYEPDRQRPGPKMLAAPGTRLGLIPHPSSETSRQIILTEGLPDMITARSCGLPAIAVPGDHAWRREWASQLIGRDITIIVHSDPQGRAAGARWATDLKTVAAGLVIVDLAPERNDGYDLSDWLIGAVSPEVGR
jgi:hypothetical protein